ncbi:uncharacterized protein LOC133334041 [Musca vetustissima]|uniref:uncharacterized protein LOC133334041 n=1 Tax=Musca vetustissima TaxID=27455 RepID=UPI002AB644F4|nr:uncharacterized protein LOC133334041 [Musca vetustissima]
MESRKSVKGNFYLGAFLVLVVLLNLGVADARSHIPARVLAKQTGATQFEEHYETQADCNEHKHSLRKRASDEDVDYEVYQGVVGRPGIDFPIYPRIPKTSFSCRSYGNGYFADMETDCQVFHICEEGRKISFLCPNGTIFQQSELTCDWWFKVNCLGSSTFYGESSELLGKQRDQHLKPVVPVQGFNIVGGGLNIKPRVPAKSTSSRSASHEYPSINKPERRIDSAEMPSIESVDFEDLSSEKSRSGITVINSNTNDEDESQITAESASFVSDRSRNAYGGADKSKYQVAAKDSKGGKSSDEGRNRGAGDRGSQRHGYVGLSSETTEKARNGQRGNQRYREEKPAQDSSDEKLNKKYKYSGSNVENKKEKFVVDSGDKLPHPTPSYVSGTYTTARRLDSTRTTPFYTPTVPSVVVKGKSGGSDGKYNKEGVATTPTPHRFNVAKQGSGLLLGEGEKKDAVKPTTSPKSSQVSEATTLRSIVIGMRHNYGEQELPRNHKYYEADIDSGESTTPATTGPTYLPKSSSSTTKLSKGSSGDNLLFAPVTDIEVNRNVNEMLKTMDVIKHNFQDVELIKQSANGSNRPGLDIPPSSGPDALVSLAKYFATEHNESSSSVGHNVNSLAAGEDKKTESVKGKSDTLSTTVLREKGEGKGAEDNSDTTLVSSKSESHSGSSNSLAPKDKPSDTTATLTTESSASLAANADDIANSLLSNKTVKKYQKLFGLDQGEEEGTETPDSKSRSGVDAVNIPATANVVTSFPQIGPTDATIRTLAEKPESRKIAQVFSNALNDYLNDPIKFRDELRSQARPTEPPFENRFVSVTDPTLFNHGTAATYLPTVAPTTNRPYSTTESNLAADINSHLITSTGYPDSEQTTNVFDATTFKSSSERKSNLEFSAELEPPSNSDSGEELLHTQHTESFVKNSRNHNEKSGKLSTDPKPQKPWTFANEDDVLDPLKINDGLMKKTTYQPKTQGKSSSFTLDTQARSHTSYSSSSSSSERIEGRQNSQYRQQQQQQQPEDPWGDLFDSYDISKENLPATTGLQRIANKLFGGLNESEALHLKNVMAEAEHNRQILRLLLLLIQTCDDHNGKALERSRKSLLGALISMDGKLHSSTKTQTRELTHTVTTTEKLPITTYRRTGSGEEITTTTMSYGSTDLPPATTTFTATTTADSGANSAEATTKFAIIVDDIGGETSAATTTTESGSITSSSGSSSPGSLDGNADKRALELLKSLYSLASKFTSRR